MPQSSSSSTSLQAGDSRPVRKGQGSARTKAVSRPLPKRDDIGDTSKVAMEEMTASSSDPAPGPSGQAPPVPLYHATPMSSDQEPPRTPDEAPPVPSEPGPPSPPDQAPPGISEPESDLPQPAPGRSEIAPGALEPAPGPSS